LPLLQYQGLPPGTSAGVRGKTFPSANLTRVTLKGVMMPFLSCLVGGRRLFMTYPWGKPQPSRRVECGGGKTPPWISHKKRPAREPGTKEKASSPPCFRACVASPPFFGQGGGKGRDHSPGEELTASTVNSLRLSGRSSKTIIKGTVLCGWILTFILPLPRRFLMA
jgi:hypothetical protein